MGLTQHTCFVIMQGWPAGQHAGLMGDSGVSLRSHACEPSAAAEPGVPRYMLELGRYVPIVPVVTKADTMTIAEAAKYRRGGPCHSLLACSIKTTSALLRRSMAVHGQK